MTVPGVSEGERTADEVIRAKEGRLRDDPEYRAQVEAVESARRERVRALRDAEQPILQDLRATGIDVGSVWDLVNTAEPYEAALPILVEHLERGTYPDRVLESLGRAVKPARQYWGRLRSLHLREAVGPGEREDLALALAASATTAEFEAMLALVNEEITGGAASFFRDPSSGSDVSEGGRWSKLSVTTHCSARRRRRG